MANDYPTNGIFHWLIEYLNLSECGHACCHCCWMKGVRGASWSKRKRMFHSPFISSQQNNRSVLGPHKTGASQGLQHNAGNSQSWLGQSEEDGFKFSFFLHGCIPSGSKKYPYQCVSHFQITWRLVKTQISGCIPVWFSRAGGEPENMHF